MSNHAMFSYFAYGLGIRSTLPLPEFVAAEAGCDVVVRFAGKSDTSPETPGGPWPFRVTPEEAILPFKGVGVFMVRGGSEIVVIPEPTVDDALIRLYLIGTVMAAVLYQRGLLVLHASAVEVGGNAIAFLGASGWGKSSIAAALHARGHAIVADDVSAVNVGERAATIVPGIPQLKLSPEAACTLGYESRSLFFLHPLEVKRGFRIRHGFPQNPLRLKRIYVLAKDTVQEIDAIQPREAVMELVRHSYPTRLLQPGGVPHLQQCAYLAREIPIYRLKRSNVLGQLPTLARLVEAHLARDY